MATFIYFYDTECPQCEETARVIADAELFFQIPFIKKNISDEPVFRLFETYATQCNCQGVPFLYCPEAKKGLCNPESFRAIKKWIKECQEVV